ncbi:MAG: hypothetical protein ACTS3T_20715, partial [Almyronema sp.]
RNPQLPRKGIETKSSRCLLFDKNIRSQPSITMQESSIESREAATQAFQKLGTGSLERLLIYVPAKLPITDEQKQVDPFLLYAECGAPALKFVSRQRRVSKFVPEG